MRSMANLKKFCVLQDSTINPFLFLTFHRTRVPRDDMHFFEMCRAKARCKERRLVAYVATKNDVATLHCLLTLKNACLHSKRVGQLV